MKLRANLLLLLAALIWGFAFVAQRVGMDYLGPYSFNGIRFALGALSLIPLLVFFRSRKAAVKAHQGWKSWQVGTAAGLILFIAASLQQIGMLYTTAGKAAFVTCLYIILVPIAGIFLGQRAGRSTWFGSVLVISGLYLLCVKEGFTISYGDILEVIGACFWTLHILWIDHFSEIDSLELAFYQFVTCSFLSLVTALCLETMTIAGIMGAAVPILYGGFCSVGIAYTLQIVGQKQAEPAHAAIILSMETVFAALGGYLLLGERLTVVELIGCVLMMMGMLLSQLCNIKKEPTTAGSLELNNMKSM
ncbi:MAG: DMT family transporter [Pelosinus sp.]|nr:DMT family transporter [Pelosinus sp.]